MEPIVIPSVGTFELEHGCYSCPGTFFGRKIDVLIYPKRDGTPPSDEWKAARQATLQLFKERAGLEIPKLPDMVRKLCREYDMYEYTEIPWTDDELLDGFNWNNIKLSNDRTVECSVEASQAPLNNFTIVFGFNKDMTLEYAHFDG